MFVQQRKYTVRMKLCARLLPVLWKIFLPRRHGYTNTSVEVTQGLTGTKSTNNPSLQQAAGANGAGKLSFARSNTKGRKQREQATPSTSTQSSSPDEYEITPLPQPPPALTQAQSEMSADIDDNLPII